MLKTRVIHQGLLFATVAFDDDDKANQFMIDSDKLGTPTGLLVIDEATGLRHVAHMSDKGSPVPPVRRLLCCCCAGETKGRQFANQDTGHGLGSCCVDYVAPRTEDMERTYGTRGIHYDIKEA